MNQSSEPAPEESPRVGPTRTFWHPLLVRLLRWLLRGGYEVRDEVRLGVLPLLADVVLVRLESGKISPLAASYMPELLPRLRKRTIIEFKSPTDSLERGDYETVVAYAMLYLKQEAEPLDNADLSLIFIAPSITSSFRESLTLRRVRIEPEPLEPGVHRIVGGFFDTWAIETDEMAELHRPLLSLFSRVFLRRPQGIMESLVKGGFGRAVFYVAEQIRQFRKRGINMAMPFPDIGGPELDPDVIDGFLSWFPVQKRLQGLSPEERLEGLSPEARLEGLSPEARLEGLSLEDLLKGLSPQQLNELKRKLAAPNGDSPTPKP